MVAEKRRPKTWIGFFDLLGTKDSARIRRMDFPTKIKRFNTVLGEQALQIKANVKLRFFSDSAYIECDSSIELIQYARRVRWILFAEEIFFKAALSPGLLNEVGHDATHEVRGKQIEIRGVSFGEDVVEVYYKQELFKGIGFFIDHRISDDALSSHLVQSCFPSADLRGWTTFQDIAYSKQEIGGTLKSDDDRSEKFPEAFSFLDHLLAAALRANTSKKDLARYYLSCFMSIVQSSSCDRVEFHNDKWDNVPAVFCHLFESKRRRDNYLSIRGHECLFIALASKILGAITDEGRPKYQDGRFSIVCDELVRVLGGLKVLKNPVPIYPSFVIAPEIREDVARRSVRLRMY